MQGSFYGRIQSENYDFGDERHDLLAYYQNQWQVLGNPSPLLEPMCGTGFFLIPFLETGADIDGLDSSPFMLAECKKKCAKKGLNPTLYQQLLEEIALPRKYGFIFIPDRSLAHIYQKDKAQLCLRQLWEHLAPEGRLILDVKTPPEKGEFGEPGQTNLEVLDSSDGSTVLITSIWLDRDDGRVIRNLSKYEKFLDGKIVETELFDYNERFYDRLEFEEMLRIAGFIDIKSSKGYDNTEPSPHDIIVFSCRKP